MSTNLVSRDIFKKYWNILKRNYSDKTHNASDFNLYFSIFKDYEEEKFIYAIKQVLINNSYFPRIDEIAKYLSNDDEPKWLKDFAKNIEVQKLSKEDQKELDEILDELV